MILKTHPKKVLRLSLRCWQRWLRSLPWEKALKQAPGPPGIQPAQGSGKVTHIGTTDAPCFVKLHVKIVLAIDFLLHLGVQGFLGLGWRQHAAAGASSCRKSLSCFSSSAMWSCTGFGTHELQTACQSGSEHDMNCTIACRHCRISCSPGSGSFMKLCVAPPPLL